MNIPIFNRHTKPLNLSMKDIDRLAYKIVKQRYKKDYKGIEDYWCITVSPTGEIFLPNIDYIGHPDMAQKKIFPSDKALQVLYDYFYPDEPDNDLLKSCFMVLYGYINLDGNLYVARVVCRYNSKAITSTTKSLIDDIKEYARMEDLSSEEHCTEEDIEREIKVAFFKKELKRIIELKYPDKDINEIINKMRKNKIEELLGRIEKKYLLYIDREKNSEKDYIK